MRGLAIPIRTLNGRLVLQSGEQQTGKIVLLAMGDGDNENPYNQDAGTQQPVFDLANPATQAIVKREIEVHFARFEANLRAKLTSIQFEELPDGEYAVQVLYHDLETDEERDVTKTVRT